MAYKDRFTRFGFNYLKRYFSNYGANIIIINQTEAKDVQNELVEDLISIITSFSGRVHGKRSRGKRKSRKHAKKTYDENKCFYSIFKTFIFTLTDYIHKSWYY